jgi:hypothetical protein
MLIPLKKRTNTSYLSQRNLHCGLVNLNLKWSQVRSLRHCQTHMHLHLHQPDHGTRTQLYGGTYSNLFHEIWMMVDRINGSCLSCSRQQKRVWSPTKTAEVDVKRILCTSGKICPLRITKQAKMKGSPRLSRCVRKRIFRLPVSTSFLFDSRLCIRTPKTKLATDNCAESLG